MKILLIDADSTIPNLSLMKISSYYKGFGHSIVLLRANLPYYPNRKKKKVNVDTTQYDLSFCSVVFSGNSEYIVGEKIEFGGSGFDIYKILPKEIEDAEPDYSIYPENDTSYGFISRGCNRTCNFCDVWRKEGKTKVVSSVHQIVKHKKVKFLDNNFLQLKNHKQILQELIDLGVRCQFNQGLDIRLINKENSDLLRRLNYLGEYIFAFDSLRYEPQVRRGLDLMGWRKPFQFKFFVYVSPEIPVQETVMRIEILKELECLPYVMRDFSCWGHKDQDFYTDLAGWCNQPGIFKNMSFDEFLNRRHKGKNSKPRIEKSYYKWAIHQGTKISPPV